MVTYNHDKYLSETIESIFRQKTNFDIKLFIGEDFSNDKSRIICKKFEKKYKGKIHVRCNEKNLGNVLNAKMTYQECISSGAKYIALCEGDDYWTDPFKLQKQFDFLEQNSDYSLCLGNLECVDELNDRRYNRILTNVDLNLTTESLLRSPLYGMTASSFMRMDVIRNGIDNISKCYPSKRQVPR